MWPCCSASDHESLESTPLAASDVNNIDNITLTEPWEALTRCWVDLQGQDIEAWIFRNIDDHEIVLSFRGTMTPGHMLTDIDLDLAVFNPGGRRESRSPEDVADEIPDEEIIKGPLEPLMNMAKVGSISDLGHFQIITLVYVSFRRVNQYQPCTQDDSTFPSFFWPSWAQPSRSYLAHEFIP